MRLLTEDEAESTWCPMAQMVTTIIDTESENVVGISAANRSKQDAPMGACIASHCAMWEWHGSKPDKPAGSKPDKPAGSSPWTQTGYCGLKRG